MAYTDREDLNYLGQLVLVGANQTPLLSMLGGMGSGKTSKSFEFPLAQPYSLTAASQPAISEADSVSSNTATTVTRGQEFNTVQIFQETVEVSHAKQSTTGEFAGIQVLGDQPVMSEFDFQKNTQLEQIGVDLEFTMINGVYQSAATAATAAKTRGLITAIATNTIAAAGASLTKALMDQLFRTMATNGAKWKNVVILCNAFQKQALSDIYGFAPTDRMIGGVNVEEIIMDFGRVAIAFDPQVATDDVIAVELDVCSLVFVPVANQIMTFEMLAKTAASEKGQWYAQIGLDYGSEKQHGSLTGLSTS